MPFRPCLSPSCPNYAERRGRCRDCNALNDKSMRRAGRALYGTKRWRILRAKKLSLDPMCQWHEGCQALATDVHHRHGVEVDPWSLEGLESLCHAHHSQLTRRGQLA